MQPMQQRDLPAYLRAARQDPGSTRRLLGFTFVCVAAAMTSGLLLGLAAFGGGLLLGVAIGFWRFRRSGQR